MTDEIESLPSALPVIVEREEASLTLPDQLAEGMDQAGVMLEAKLAPTTRDAYERAFLRFWDWAIEQGLCPLPAEVVSVAAYLGLMHKRGLTPSRLNVLRAAIAWKHRNEGLEDPTVDQRILHMMHGARRLDAQRVKKRAQALTARDGGGLPGEIQRIIAAITTEDLAAKRDRALILIGFEGGFRRSELAGLHLQDLDWQPDGLFITPRVSKTDQQGEGFILKFIAPASPAVQALNDWLQALEAATGRQAAAGAEGQGALPVFVGFGRPKILRDRNGERVGLRPTPRRDALSGRSVYDILQQRATDAGLDASKITGHSLRAGYVTSALAAGADLWDVMAQTGHKSVQSLSGYVRRANAAKRMGGKSLL